MYSALAKFYDKFMKEVNYDRWIAYIMSFLDGRKTGVDFGCGTGAITTGFVKNGLDVYGVDISPEMLREATARARDSLADVKFILGDIAKFEFIHKVDFVTAICDTINYIKNPQKAFINVYNNLKDGGIFIFDISSEYKLINILANNTFSETIDDTTYVWQNVKVGNRIDMSLVFFQPNNNGLYTKTEEKQTQYIHKNSDIIDCLKSVGFEVSVYGDMTRRSPTAASERVHFIAYK